MPLNLDPYSWSGFDGTASGSPHFHKEHTSTPTPPMHFQARHSRRGLHCHSGDISCEEFVYEWKKATM